MYSNQLGVELVQQPSLAGYFETSWDPTECAKAFVLTSDYCYGRIQNLADRLMSF